MCIVTFIAKRKLLIYFRFVYLSNENGIKLQQNMKSDCFDGITFEISMLNENVDFF